MSYPLNLPEQDPRHVTPMGHDPREDVAICPECTQGKHVNCDSSAWSDLTDFPCVCDCFKADHDLPEGLI